MTAAPEIHFRPLGPSVFEAGFVRGSDDFDARELLLADIHIDNKHCLRGLLRDILDEALERGARTHIFGDLFDVMGGKYDPRSSKGDLRPELQVDDYFDALVDDAVAFFAPYASILGVVSPGNHETAVLKRHETDLVRRFVKELNREHGGSAHVGTYAGWIVYRFARRNPSGSTGQRNTIRLHYDHGYGGGGEVTRGTIQANRRAVRLPDADIVVSGHIHEGYQMPIPRERILESGRVILDEQLHLAIPTMKEEYLSHEGFHTEKGRNPKPLGGWWLDFAYRRRSRSVEFTATRAK